MTTPAQQAAALRKMATDDREVAEIYDLEGDPFNARILRRNADHYDREADKMDPPKSANVGEIGQ